MIAALLLLPILVVSFVLLRDAKAKLERSFAPASSCRGLVKVTNSQHDVRTVEGRDRLYVRVQVANGSESDISDPVIKVEALDASGSVIDTFHRMVVGANVAPIKPYWLRVDAELTVIPASISRVRAEVASADCKSAWR